MIKQIFLPDEADAIHSIPRSCNQARDHLIWAYTPRGTSTANSAYKATFSLSPQAHSCKASNDQDHNLFWRTIWSLNIPNKLKTFAWRASRNILPIKVNLCHCGVLDDPTCEACGLGDETDGLFFWDYTATREIWEATRIPFDIRGVHYSEFVDLI